MRSIRRSMTVYMLVLLVATLGVVWIVIDQVTARALAAREAAGADKINATYQERVRQVRRSGHYGPAHLWPVPRTGTRAKPHDRHGLDRLWLRSPYS